MIREIHTIREAAEEWVREMNAIPCDMINKLMSENVDYWHELTVPSAGDRVYVFNVEDCIVDNSGCDNEDCDFDESYGEIIYYNEETERYTITMDNGIVIECEENNFDVERDDILPMWGTMWSFGDSCDDYWLEDKGGIRKMSECGFRVYASDDFGYFFGIDGAGYSFYDEHWIPLYKARGLRWHDTEAE